MAINGEQFLQALDELEALKGINKFTDFWLTIIFLG